MFKTYEKDCKIKSTIIIYILVYVRSKKNFNIRTRTHEKTLKNKYFE